MKVKDEWRSCLIYGAWPEIGRAGRSLVDAPSEVRRCMLTGHQLATDAHLHHCCGTMHPVAAKARMQSLTRARVCLRISR